MLGPILAFATTKESKAAVERTTQDDTDTLVFQSSDTNLSMASLKICLAFAVVAIVVSVVYKFFVYPLYASPLRHLPGPKDNIWFFGQCHNMLRASWVPHLFHDWSRRWPGSPFIRYLGVANSECLIVNSVAAYRDILQTQSSHFAKPALTRRYARMIIGDALPFAEGTLHRRRRAALTGAFNTSHIKAMVPAMREKARQLSCLLDDSRRLGPVEVESALWKTTLDIIGIDVLGADLDHLGSGTSSPLHELFGRTMRQSTLGHVIHYLDSYLPLRKLIPIQRNNDFRQSCAEARRYLREQFTARTQGRNNSSWEKSAPRPDALQRMLDQPTLWEDDEIVEYLLNLVILGHDTTACTLVWAVYALSTYSQYQERLRTEVTSHLQDRNEVTYDDLERLPFMENFLREVLRVFCPVPYVPREVTEKVEVDGVLLPKGTVVNLCPAVINLHPLVWGDDAAEFNPDRWRTFDNVAGGAYAFESFHHGPRICLGKQLSMTEMKVILVEIVSRFRIEAVGTAKPMGFASPSFTLRPAGGLSVQLLEVVDAEVHVGPYDGFV